MGRKPSKLKLPDDFLGTVSALLNTPPPPKGKRKAKKLSKRKERKS